MFDNRGDDRSLSAADDVAHCKPSVMQWPMTTRAPPTDNFPVKRPPATLQASASRVTIALAPLGNAPGDIPPVHAG